MWSCDHWFVDVVRIREHWDCSDSKAGGGRSANMEQYLDQLVHVNVELAKKVAEFLVRVLGSLGDPSFKVT